MQITIDLTLYALILVALCVSLTINGIIGIIYLGHIKPDLIYKEDK